MEPKDKKNWFSLSKKSLSLLAASVAVIAGNKTRASALPPSTSFVDGHTITSAKKALKPKLVLKLNIAAPSASLLMMHTSHSSHASHASHSSHASSSPSYSPSYTPDPVTVRRTVIPAASPVTPLSSSTDTVFYRTLTKGCKGPDVKMVQNLLKKKGYNTPVSGYFGQQTVNAVKKFQQKTDLPSDGSVNSLTFSMIKE